MSQIASSPAITDPIIANIDDLSLTSRVFTTVRWRGLVFYIYKNERDFGTDGIGASGATYFYQPALTLTRNDDGAIAASANGTKVFIPFLNIPDGLIETISQQVNQRESDIGSNPQVSSDQIIMMPIKQIEISVDHPGVIGSWKFPDSVTSNLFIDQQIVSEFKCNSDQDAERFADSVRSGRVIFSVILRVPMTKVDESTVRISSVQCKKMNWKNIINDNAHGSPEFQALNQFVTIDQVADSFGSLLSGMNISVTMEGEPSKDTEITKEEEATLFENFRAIFLEDATLNFPPAEAQDIYIGRESFNPDTIGREKQHIESAMTTAIERVIDTAQEDITHNRDVYDGKSALETLNKEYKDISGNIQIAGGANLINIISGNIDLEGKFKYKSDTLGQMKSDVSQHTEHEFSNETRDKMRMELKDYLNQSSKYDWEIEQNKIIPKKIKLKRIVTSGFQEESVLLNRKRRLTRQMSDIPFQRRSDQAVNLSSFYTLGDTVFTPLRNCHISSYKVRVNNGISEEFKVIPLFTGHVYVHSGGDLSMCFIVGTDNNSNFAFKQKVGVGRLIDDANLEQITQYNWRFVNFARRGASAEYIVTEVTVVWLAVSSGI